MKRFVWLTIFLYSLFFVTTFAAPLTLKDETQLLLPQSEVFFDTQDLSFSAVKDKQFIPYSAEHINFAFDAKTHVWVKLLLHNASEHVIEKVIEFDNPLLESITLYENNQTLSHGMLHIAIDQHQINPSFKLHFDANETKELWLEVHNMTTALQFTMLLKSSEQFYHDDQMKKYAITLFLGIILAFLTYALFLYAYTKDKSYLLYGFYLGTLIFQQMTYLGFLPLYAPAWFNKIDALIVVPKVAMMIIAAAWFAQSFLKTAMYQRLDSIYKGIVIFLFIQMPLFGTPWFYYPEVTVLTGLVFIIFNTYAGFYVYRKGNKQARFFIAGWLVLIFAYLLMIFDALGIISVMYLVPDLLMWATALEALFLLLAFVDKLNLLQSQKNSLNTRLVEELHNRNRIVNETVAARTQELNEALNDKRVLLKELHHRVKNNLQLILSLIRLQSQSLPCEEKERYFTDLENRIKAIAKTHENLYLNEHVDAIDMQEYLENLVSEIQLGYSLNEVQIHFNIDAILPIREAVYVGLVINELVTNSMKYAFKNKKGTINITFLQKDKAYTLIYEDSGEGYEPSKKSTDSIGLDLVESLITLQLGGTLEMSNTEHLHYKIGFSL